MQMPDEIVIPPVRGPSGARRGGSRAALGMGLVLVFALGAGLAGWAGWKSGADYQKLVPALMHPGALALDTPIGGVSRPAAVTPAAQPPADAAALARLEGSVGALETRLALLRRDADGAARQANRAEGLLVAAAARRAIERGEPLGPLADQLRLRFGDSEPNAVATLTTFSRSPVTLDRLTLGLDAMARGLAERDSDETAWARIQRELATLFVIRHETAPQPEPVVRIATARMMLGEGRVDEAARVLATIPGLARLDDWTTAARRYEDAQRALELVELRALAGPAEPALTPASASASVPMSVPMPAKPVG